MRGDAGRGRGCAAKGGKACVSKGGGVVPTGEGKGRVDGGEAGGIAGSRGVSGGSGIVILGDRSRGWAGDDVEEGADDWPVGGADGDEEVTHPQGAVDDARHVAEVDDVAAMHPAEVARGEEALDVAYRVRDRDTVAIHEVNEGLVLVRLHLEDANVRDKVVGGVVRHEDADVPRSAGNG